jgi:segregation and condensation protein B
MSSLKSKIESLLFISNRPLTIKAIMESTGAEKEAVSEQLDILAAEYNGGDRGIILQRIDQKVQVVTIADNSKLVRDFIKDETTGELSRAALETLTVVAYRGPVTRAEIEQIRGVNCAIILRNLLIRGLIESKSDAKKMQTKYNITFDFLKFLGLSEVAQLPDYERLNSSESLNKFLEGSNLVGSK